MALKVAMAVYRLRGVPSAMPTRLQSLRCTHCPLQVLVECDAFFFLVRLIKRGVFCFSFAGMIMVILLLLVAIVVVAVWPTN